MIGRLLRYLKDFFRELDGYGAYTRYLHHHATMHSHEQPKTRKEFFDMQTKQKWERINRCC